MADSFGNSSDQQDFPVRKMAAITPHNDNDLAYITKAIYVATDGNLEIIAADDSASVTIPVMANTVLPVRVKRVRAAGTTATVFAMY